MTSALRTDTNPRKEEVDVVVRPQNPLDLFVETNFRNLGLWKSALVSPRSTHGYIEGMYTGLDVASLGDSPASLGNHGHFKAIQTWPEFLPGGSWKTALSNQLNCRVSSKFARDTLREGVPLSISKLLMVPFALESAIHRLNEDLPEGAKVNPMLPYSLVRVRVAGYNFGYKAFIDGKLNKLRMLEGFEEGLMKATGQVSFDVFEDIAAGYLVCHNTAFIFKEFVESYVDDVTLHLGKIEFFPNHQRSKGRKPSPNEALPI